MVLETSPCKLDHGPVPSLPSSFIPQISPLARIALCGCAHSRGTLHLTLWGCAHSTSPSVGDVHTPSHPLGMCALHLSLCGHVHTPSRPLGMCTLSWFTPAHPCLYVHTPVAHPLCVYVHTPVAHSSSPYRWRPCVLTPGQLPAVLLFLYYFLSL